MAIELHQYRCRKCGDYIPFTRRVLVFRPVPRELTCPTCGHVNSTTFGLRVMALFAWTMRSYMGLGILFLLILRYAKLYFPQNGLRGIPWFILHEGGIILLIGLGICLLTSFTVQGLADYFFQVGKK